MDNLACLAIEMAIRNDRLEVRLMEYGSQGDVHLCTASLPLDELRRALASPLPAQTPRGGM
jgi:hypothetical protein